MLLSLCVALSVLLAPSLGYPYFREQIPNGNNVPHPCKVNYKWQGVGHENPLGGGVRNVFGLAFKAAGYQWTQELCHQDSDGDGKMNGEELGDPNCVWSASQIPSRTTNISHPGVCDPIDSPQCEGKNDFVTCEIEKFDNCSAINNPEVMIFDARFRLTQIPPTETNYYCMTFDLPSDQDYHIIATEPIINNSNVLHHMLLYGCHGDGIEAIDPPELCGMSTNNCETIIGTWTVGLPGVCYGSNLGFRIGKTAFKRVVLQIHYNNPQRISSYTDSSGLKLFYQPEKPDTLDLVTFATGQELLTIPPGQVRVEKTAVCPSECTNLILKKNAYIRASVNHMHYLGYAMKVEQFRDGQLIANITHEDVYNYDSPMMNDYDPPIELRPGDELKTTCVFNSMSTNRYTYYGEDTFNEMCYGFLFMYPADALLPQMTWCVAQGPVSVCDLIKGKPINNCDWSSFVDLSNPTSKNNLNRLRVNCNLDGFCRPECREVVRELNQHPCLSGEMAEFVKHKLSKRGVEGMEFLGRLQSCPTDNSIDEPQDCSDQCSEVCPKPGGSKDGSYKMAATSGVVAFAVTVVLLLV